MHALLEFVLKHGYVVLLAAVLVEQLGAPVPAAPVMLAVGALAGTGHFSLSLSVALAVLAALVSDTIWFHLGKRRGHAILALLCRISLEPDSCVNNTRHWFHRLGGWALVIAKFVPGLNTVAAPIAGMSRMPLFRFLLSDGFGALLWVGTFLGLGYAFSSQLEQVAEHAVKLGSGLFVLLLAALGGYLGQKFYQRRRFIRKLRMARITPEELLERIESGEELVIIDLRHSSEAADSPKLPGATWLDRRRLDEHHQQIPRDRDIILYCS